MARHTIFLAYNPTAREQMYSILAEMKRRGKVIDFHGRADESSVEVVTNSEHREEVLQCQAGK